LADQRQTARPLTYSLRDIDTVKAECERFAPFAEGSSGFFRQAGKLQVDQLADSKKELELSFEMTVTGEPKDAEKGKLAFVARCKVSCIAAFSKEQGEELPQHVLREIVATLHALASERCRYLVISMGYPGPVLGAVPGLEPAKETAATAPRKTMSKSTSAKPRAKRKVTTP
jgi:hypothetical protein